MNLYNTDFFFGDIFRDLNVPISGQRNINYCLSDLLLTRLYLPVIFISTRSKYSKASNPFEIYAVSGKAI